ncbi:MAG: hypothetical protein U5N58_09995 [Actinomycetota bacterium]|nr:hypothetical protein [Actinomycetota bacterium]
MIKQHEIEIMAKQLKKQFNSPVTTSMGRLFDAVSSLLNLTHTISYEGQAAIHLESIADVSIDQGYDLALRDNRLDDISLVEQILEDIQKKTPASIISAKFHNCLVGAIIDICKMAQDRYNICQVALSGGVFQNSFLLSKTLSGLKENGFKAYTNFKVPVNDGGISLGQAYLAAFKLKKEN